MYRGRSGHATGVAITLHRLSALVGWWKGGGGGGREEELNSGSKYSEWTFPLLL